MASHPRGAWIWRRSRIDVDHVQKLAQRNAKRVYLKVFDGKSNPMFWGFQCSPPVVQAYEAHGVEVWGWGYHYGTPDVDAQAAAVRQALACGLKGYVLDLEVEVEDAVTHPHVQRLLAALRPHVREGGLAYTSFGHPGFHPGVPWRMLDQACDVAMPQIYFERFTFAPTNEEEVQACLEAHEALGLTLPILPIWGSESDTPHPALADELQSYLDRFPGSSVWRVPNRGERGEALRLDYGGAPFETQPSANELPSSHMPPTLRRGDQGGDVKTLQEALNALGIAAGAVDGDFGPKTEQAVRAFQQDAGLAVDGVVGPVTWAALNDR